MIERENVDILTEIFEMVVDLTVFDANGPGDMERGDLAGIILTEMVGEDCEDILTAMHRIIKVKHDEQKAQYKKAWDESTERMRKFTREGLKITHV